jgi:transcriptional regulator with XRE-family HTH domain
MTGKALRAKRAAAGIAGHAICARAGLLRSRLSDIENGHVTATADEIERIVAAIDGIVQARERVESLATAEGFSLVGVL